MKLQNVCVHQIKQTFLLRLLKYNIFYNFDMKKITSFKQFKENDISVNNVQIFGIHGSYTYDSPHKGFTKAYVKEV